MLDLRMSDCHALKVTSIILLLLIALSWSGYALAKQHTEVRQQVTIVTKSPHLIVAKGQLYIAPRNDELYKTPC